MKTEKIINNLRENQSLKEEDYFKSAVFYYLAGRYPDLSISQCADIVDQLRKETGLMM